MTETICPAELEKTWKKFKNTGNEQIRHQLANHYFPYVQKISVKMAEKLGWKVQPEELASFGVDGLYKAIEGFDLSQNVKFESYASRRINGSMIDGLRREDSVPRSVRIATEQFKRHKDRVQSHVGHRLSDVEFVSIIGMDEEDYQKNFRKYNASSKASLDHHSDDGKEEDICQDSNDNLINDSNSSPDAKVKRKEFFSKIMSGDFTKTEQKIIYLHYYEAYTMERVAKAINRSESRVSQLHKKILPRLKDKIDRNPEYFSEDVASYMGDCNDKESIF